MVKVVAFCCMLFLIWAFSRPLPVEHRRPSLPSMETMRLVEHLVPPEKITVQKRARPKKKGPVYVEPGQPVTPEEAVRILAAAPDMLPPVVRETNGRGWMRN